IKWLDQNNNYSDKIRRMTDYCKSARVQEVPDPYYGGHQGFENVLDLLEDSCKGLLEFVSSKNHES
ncbi:MAG: low molecular weight phosphotyrosine protein phosphatase, partial [SAR324 cluster bacterium]|nr:low molecular weight phosphotyrosine protein phosphatase [SAR324 cluster bacterium]